MIEFPPTYREIAAKLAREIDSGEWPPGSQLPSARDLGVEHKVSPATAMRALRLLQEQGLAVGRQGRGFIVTNP